VQPFSNSTEENAKRMTTTTNVISGVDISLHTDADLRSRASSLVRLFTRTLRPLSLAFTSSNWNHTTVILNQRCTNSSIHWPWAIQWVTSLFGLVFRSFQNSDWAKVKPKSEVDFFVRTRSKLRTERKTELIV